MEIKSINQIKNLFKSEKITYVFKNPYFLNQEIALFKDTNTVILDGLTLFRFHFDILQLDLKGNKLIFNSTSDIAPFINYYGKEQFNYMLDVLLEKFDHLLFFISQKEMQYFDIEHFYFLDINEEQKIIGPILTFYGDLIFPFLSKVSNGQLSVFSILHTLATEPGLKLSQIAKKIGKKSPVAKVYLNRMLDSNLIISQDKKYFIPSNYFTEFLANKKNNISFSFSEEEIEESNNEKKNDFDYLN